MRYNLYSEPEITTKTVEEIQDGEVCTVRFTVKNVSNVAGSAVPQLYIRRSGGTVTHRAKELCAFQKVYLQPGETQDITFAIGYDALAEWSVNRRYELFPMQVYVMLGNSSEDTIIPANDCVSRPLLLHTAFYPHLDGRQ